MVEQRWSAAEMGRFAQGGERIDGSRREDQMGGATADV